MGHHRSSPVTSAQYRDGSSPADVANLLPRVPLRAVAALQPDNLLVCPVLELLVRVEDLLGGLVERLVWGRTNIGIA